MNRTIDLTVKRPMAIDQTRLPGEERVLLIADVPTLAEAIKPLRIQGVAGGLGIALAVRQAKRQWTEVQAAAGQAGAVLAATRPAAVNLCGDRPDLTRLGRRA